jgi:hypothetical protein
MVQEAVDFFNWCIHSRDSILPEGLSFVINQKSLGILSFLAIALHVPIELAVVALDVISLVPGGTVPDLP